MFEGTGAELMDFVFAQHRKADATSHPANVLIDVQGDRAMSESYVTACIRTGGHDITVRGGYSDRWSCRSGQWGIDERRYRHDIVQSSPAPGLEYPTADERSPRRSPSPPGPGISRG